MLASGVAGARRFPRWSAIKLLVVRRGLARAILTPIRWVLMPLVRCDIYQFFEWDLAQQALDVPAVDGVSVGVLRGAEHSRTVRVALCPLESLKPEEIEHRLERGDSVAIAWADRRAVGYAWSAYSALAMSEIGATVHVGSSDIVGYDGYVTPRRRGQGILPLLDAAQIDAAVECGRKRQLVYTSTRNRSTSRSIREPESAGSSRSRTSAFPSSVGS